MKYENEVKALMEMGLVTVDCQGTAVTVEIGHTVKDSDLDIDWPNGNPRVTISDQGTLKQIVEDFERIMDELPRLLMQAEAVRDQ